jgi:Pyruvate/2-oxoacid:ferredoxin oxidoreductase delta subunit
MTRRPVSNRHASAGRKRRQLHRYSRSTAENFTDADILAATAIHHADFAERAFCVRHTDLENLAWDITIDADSLSRGGGGTNTRVSGTTDSLLLSHLSVALRLAFPIFAYPFVWALFHCQIQNKMKLAPRGRGAWDIPLYHIPHNSYDHQTHQCRIRHSVSSCQDIYRAHLCRMFCPDTYCYMERQSAELEKKICIMECLYSSERLKGMQGRNDNAGAEYTSIPHFPQFFGSSPKSMQTPSQSVFLSGHSGLQIPSLQICLSGHYSIG